MQWFNLKETKLKKQELPQSRSYVFTTVIFVLCVSQLVLAGFADVSHLYIDENECPERKASIPSKLSFCWFDRLVFLGYHRLLKQDALWSLQPQLTSEVNCQLFEERWNKEMEKKKRHYMNTSNQDSYNLSHKYIESPSLFVVLWKTYGLLFTLVMIMRVVSESLFIVNPLMLRQIIAHVEDKNDPLWHGYFFCLIILISETVQYVMVEQHLFHCIVIGIKMRAALISIIYKKVLKMSNSSKSQSTVGEIVNLVGVDTQNIREMILEAGSLFSIPVQISIAVYMLWELFGIASVAGVAAMLILFPMNMVILYRVKALQMSIMELKDERIKLINEILNGIKVLKLYAWELSFYNLIQKIREKELKIIRNVAFLQCIVVFLFNCTPFLAIISVKRIQHFMQLTDLDPDAVKHESDGFVGFPISVSNGSFAWSENSDSTLRDIELVVPHGHLIAVVGPVGAGKSSLISAILGEMIKHTGHVKLHGRIAYVSQQTWIQNATLRDNILFGKEYEKTFYEKVIETCALIPDIDMMPAGDFTELGEKGINLSGGQRQRVSLARAVYNDADLYFLDDPLSAVDAHVGKYLFQKVIGPQGILSAKVAYIQTYKQVN